MYIYGVRIRVGSEGMENRNKTGRALVLFFLPAVPGTTYLRVRLLSFLVHARTYRAHHATLIGIIIHAVSALVPSTLCTESTQVAQQHTRATRLLYSANILVASVPVSCARAATVDTPFAFPTVYAPIRLLKTKSDANLWFIFPIPVSGSIGDLVEQTCRPNPMFDRYPQLK